MSAQLDCSDLEVYRLWLLELYSLWAPMEQRLLGSTLFLEQPQLKSLLRTERMREDLAHLYGAEFQPDAVALADFTSISATAPSIYGLAYVWAGSIHGAQVLAAQLRNGLELTPETGGAFFMLDDPKACRGVLMAFYGWLDENVVDDDAQTATAAAQRAYQIFLDWYQRAK